MKPYEPLPEWTAFRPLSVRWVVSVLLHQGYTKNKISEMLGMSRQRLHEVLQRADAMDKLMREDKELRAQIKKSSDLFRKKTNHLLKEKKSK